MTITVPDPPLSDGVVTLRPPDERDLDAIDAGIHDPEVVRWFGPPASAVEVLAENRTRWAAGSPTFAICEPDGACVGHVWINLVANEAGSGELGYWLLPNARGRGLAVRAVRLLMPWALDALGLTRLLLVTEAANEPSQRVAARSGFRRTGTVTARGGVDGRVVDRMVFVWPSGDEAPSDD